MKIVSKTSCSKVFAFVFLCGQSSNFGNNGLLITKICDDQNCCVNCKEVYVEYKDFDGSCIPRRQYSDMYTCTNGEDYIHQTWENPNCHGPASGLQMSGICYSMQNWKSYYFECSSLGLGTSANNNGNEDSASHEKHIIEIVVVLLVFSFGAVVGYSLYKKRNKSN